MFLGGEIWGWILFLWREKDDDGVNNIFEKCNYKDKFKVYFFMNPVAREERGSKNFIYAFWKDWGVKVRNKEEERRKKKRKLRVFKGNLR